jgi:hypothetical protein
MTTKAALQFRQRGPEPTDTEDGLNLKSWYQDDDIKRVIWRNFTQSDQKNAGHSFQPFVFPYIPPSYKYTLRDMLNPLVTKLETSKDKKYFPFIFNPEVASSHTVAGFLRKNKDDSVSIFIFNPTGTKPRITFDYDPYQFAVNDGWIEKNTLYFSVEDNELKYTVINPNGAEVTGSFTKKNLVELGIDLDLNKSLTEEMIKEKLNPKAAEILKLTLDRGHTESKNEIISSTKKVQTQTRDAGPLTSCGPLSLAFVEFLMLNPDYMENVTKDFDLPDFLNVEDDKYTDLVTSLRQHHYDVLDTVEDEAINSGEVDASYAEVTDLVLTSRDNKQTQAVEDAWGDEDNWDDEAEESPQESEPKLELELELEPKPKPKSELALEPKSKPNSDSELAREPKSEPKPELALEPKLEPKPKLELEPKLEPKPPAEQSGYKTLEPEISLGAVVHSADKKTSKIQELEKAPELVVHNVDNNPSMAPALRQAPKTEPTVVVTKPGKKLDSEQPKQAADLKIDQESRADVKFIRSQIERFRANAKSCFSINNEMKAKAIETALDEALGNKVNDVRLDPKVKDALALHRIFSFFGTKTTTASTELEESLINNPPKQ